jgi:hypothetical protein
MAKPVNPEPSIEMNCPVQMIRNVRIFFGSTWATGGSAVSVINILLKVKLGDRTAIKA